jgi:hypothetical protein
LLFPQQGFSPHSSSKLASGIPLHSPSWQNFSRFSRHKEKSPIFAASNFIQTIRYAENQSYPLAPPMTTSAFRLANEKDPIN